MGEPQETGQEKGRPAGAGSELTRTEFRRVQMEILGRCDDFCRARGMPYFLCGGTLLGAVRHGGYIPWDDDIDLMMLRADYDRFIEEFPSSPEGAGLSVHSLVNDPDWPYPFMKVADRSTRLVEETHHDAVFGVNIDVFALDGFVEGRVSRASQTAEVNSVRALHLLQIMTPREGRAWFKAAFLRAAQLLLSRVPRAWLLRRWDGAARRASVREDRKIALRTGLVDWEVPYAAMMEPVDLTFEGRAYLAPADTPLVLTAMFGDYMQLPPPEKQVTTHRFHAFRV